MPGKNLIQISANIHGETKVVEKKVLRNAKGIIAEEKLTNKIVTGENYGDSIEKLQEEQDQMANQKQNADDLMTAGVMEVPQGAAIQPNSLITRGEMISWLVVAAGVSIPEVDGPVLKDVPQDHKYAPFIKAALDAGFIKADPNGKFRPDDLVTEQEGTEFFKAFGISQ